MDTRAAFAMLCGVLRRPGFPYLVFLFLLLLSPLRGSANPPENVLVLPFSNLSANHNLDWVGESFAVSIFQALSGELPFVVQSEVRDNALRQMNVRKYAPLTNASVLEIAVNVDAVMVIAGSVEMIPGSNGARDGLRVRAQLYNARKLRHIKDFDVSGKMDELSLVQSHLAWQVLSALRPEAAVTEQEYLAARPPVRLDAIERYVRGLIATSYDQKLKLFTAAARLQPDYSAACYELGTLYYSRHEFRSAAEWLERVAPADAHFRQALFRLGLAHYHTGDYKLAAQAFEKLSQAISLSEVLNNLGVAQLRSGDPQAIGNLQKAIEGDSADPDYSFNAGLALYRKGDFEAAIPLLESTLTRKPDDEAASRLLGKCKRKEAARPGEVKSEALERIKENYDETAWLQLKALIDPDGRK
jgi:tetratricopeptide (TPR) repeat protein